MVLRARVGLRPTRPQQAAGARMEPKPSVACAMGSMRAPTAAAAPPLDPPEIRERSQGLRVGRLDALDRGLEQLGGRHLAPAHEFGEAEGVVAFVVGEAPHRLVFSPLLPSPPR